ncbi:MAG: hypothetical protein H6624_00225 [Bdellovibrionaceae bacterium]|nr:hypothetical protein [Bdellovibrionales bacterium]MCB9082732.1 hypothetical protein [Pseudobdellovibrionaceae bacterium]
MGLNRTTGVSSLNRICFIALFLLSSLPILAQGPLPHLDFSITGTAYPELDMPTITKSEHIYEFKADGTLQKKRWSFSYEFYGKYQGQSEFPRERLLFDLPNTYLEYRQALWRLRLGSQVYDWGVLEGFRPLDRINPSIYHNPLNPQKLGAGSAQLLFEKGNWQTEVLFIPQQRRSHFPAEDSPWLPREFLQQLDTAFGTILLPKDIRYHYLPSIVSQRALQGNAGLRLKWRSLDWDLSVSHFEGVNPVPLLRPVVDLVPVVIGPEPVYRAQSDVSLEPYYYRQRTSGLTAVYAGEEWIARVEAAYHHALTEESGVDQWAWEGGVNVERSGSIGSTAWTALLQYHQGEHAQQADNLASSSARIFDEAWVLGYRLGFSEQQSLTLRSLYSPPASGSYLSLIWEDTFWDRFKIQLSGSWLDGDKESLLGTYRKNDAYQITVQTYF